MDMKMKQQDARKKRRRKPMEMRHPVKRPLFFVSMMAGTNAGASDEINMKPKNSFTCLSFLLLEMKNLNEKTNART